MSLLLRRVFTIHQLYILLIRNAFGVAYNSMCLVFPYAIVMATLHLIFSL